MLLKSETIDVTRPERIRSTRIAAGLSIDEAAHFAGVSKSTWWRWETSEVRIKPRHALAIVAVLSGGTKVMDE